MPGFPIDMLWWRVPLLGAAIAVCVWLPLTIIGSPADFPMLLAGGVASAAILVAAVLASIRGTVRDHIPQLRARATTLITRNRYGALDTGAWDREKAYFVDTVLAATTPYPRWLRRYASAYIDAALQRLPPDDPAPEPVRPADPDVDAMSGDAYEAYCADILRAGGWDARLTPNPDQGVDIIATRDGLRVAIQCKRWAGNVGNQAVQAVIAGREYVKADAAAVVSTAAYTQDARGLAAAIGVHLLHHTDLPGLYDRLLDQDG